MRKLLLTGLLIVFVGIGFAETAEIVNPPRPARNFKKLLVVEHPPIMVHGEPAWPYKFFIYLNDYEIRESLATECRQSFIIPEDEPRIFSDNGKDMTEYYRDAFLLYSKNCQSITGDIDINETNTKFLEAKISKQPVGKTQFPFPIKNKRVNYRPQKAKVVFR